MDATRLPVEQLVQGAVQWLRLGVETLGAAVIAVGILVAVAALARQIAACTPINFNAIRISFARFLALALEFQLAADILSTAIAPNWDQIGKLGAIAIIRTALNFFLMREMKEENARVGDAAGVAGIKPESIKMRIDEK